MVSAGSAVGSGNVVIEGGIILAYQDGEHRLLENGVVVYTGDRIVHVGSRYDGPVAQRIDARRHIVIPGLISTHAHVSAQEGNRIITDAGRRDFLRSGFLNYLPTKLGGGASFFQHQDKAASVRFGMASLIRNGVTTVVPFDAGGPDNGKLVCDLAGEIGLRIYYAPTVSGAEYHFDDAGRLRMVWDENAGLAALDRVAEFIERLDGAHEGRVRAIVTVDEAFTATPRMLERAKSLALERKLGLTLHFAEQVYEFHETVRQSGRTPVQLLAEQGLLYPGVVLAHCLYVSGHSYITYPYGDDVGTIAESGASVSHSPLVYARRGIALESFQRYLDRGVNMSLGTDAFPLDLFDEMRAVAHACKLVEHNHEVARSIDIFNAATLGGARALGRDDLGRLAPGAKADIVILDTDTLRMGPIADPIRTIVHLATSDMVETVIVDGRTLVEGRRLLVCDERQVLEAARRSARRMWDSFGDYHWAGRTAEEEFPPSLRRWSE